MAKNYCRKITTSNARIPKKFMATCVPKTNALPMALLPLGLSIYCISGVLESQR